MRLTELDPSWLKLNTETSFGRVDTLAESDGLLFLCPTCFQWNAGPIGTHSVICWRPRVPQSVGPKPGRWEFNGTSFEDVTLVAGSSSVFLTFDTNYQCTHCGRVGHSIDATCRFCPCRAHFFINTGNIVFC